MSHWLIYFLTRVDALKMIIEGIGVFCFGVMLVLFVIRANVFERPPTIKEVKYAFFALIFFLLSSLIPSSKQFAAIYLIPVIVNNEQVKELPNNILRVVNAKCEEYLVDLFEIEKGE